MRRVLRILAGLCGVLAAASTFGESACDPYSGGDEAASPVDASNDVVTIDSGGADIGDAGCAADVISDPNHCGACGHDCLGGNCNEGKCTPVAIVDFSLADDRCAVSDAAGCYWGIAGGIVTDDTWVYFSDVGDQSGGLSGGILRVRKDAGSLSKPEGVGTIGPIRWIAADADFLYWKTGSDVGRIAKTGGPPTYLSTGELSTQSFEGPTIDGTSVLFGTATGVRQLAVTSVDAGSVEAFPDSGTVGDVSFVRASNDVIVWSTVGDAGDGIGAHARTGGDVRTVAVNQTVRAFTLEGTVVYWVNATGEVWRADTATQTIVPYKLATTDVAAQAIVVAGADLYIATWGSKTNTAAGINGSVFRTSKMPGTSVKAAEAVFQGPILVGDLAVDDRAIYFTGWFVPTVFRLAR